MLEQDYTRIFKGRYVDMRLHDLEEDTWMLCEHDTTVPIVIGSRESIIIEYDKINASGEIPKY